MNNAGLNVLALAYMGDSIYEVYIRDYLISKNIVKVKDLQKEAIKFVSAKNQARFLRKMLEDNYLNEEELDVVKRARNHKSRSSKSTDIITYKHSTALEALIGYLYLKEDKEEIYFYPNEEVKVKMEEEITEQAEAAQQVISQAWLDVLQQGAWENTNTDRTFTLEFKDGKLIQKKIEEDKTVNELTYDYRVVTVNPDQDGAVFVITKIDDNGRKEEVSFSIGEKGSKYALRGDPGSFNWITIYEKEYEAVSPTQDGTTREEATKKNV